MLLPSWSIKKLDAYSRLGKFKCRLEKSSKENSLKVLNPIAWIRKLEIESKNEKFSVVKL